MPGMRHVMGTKYTACCDILFMGSEYSSCCEIWYLWANVCCLRWVMMFSNQSTLTVVRYVLWNHSTLAPVRYEVYGASVKCLGWDMSWEQNTLPAVIYCSWDQSNLAAVRFDTYGPMYAACDEMWCSATKVSWLLWDMFYGTRVL